MPGGQFVGYRSEMDGQPGMHFCTAEPCSGVGCVKIPFATAVGGDPNKQAQWLAKQAGILSGLDVSVVGSGPKTAPTFAVSVKWAEH